MAIKKVRISNFKSFKDVEIELGKLNVLIGPNASGKSNFIEIFRFLRDIVMYGLNNAIFMQGGVKYFRNVKIGSSRDFSLRIVYDQEFMFQITKERRPIMIKTNEAIYEFSLVFNDREEEFEISKDTLTLQCEFLEMETSNKKEKTIEIGTGEIKISNVKGKLKYDLNLPENDIFPIFSTEMDIPSKTLLVETSLFFFMPLFEKFVKNIPVYNFDSKQPRRIAPITGKMELEEDGSNLAVVLENLTKNKEKKRKLSNLIDCLLPFIDDLTVERFVDKSLRLRFRETYTSEQYLSTSVISDGTTNMIALIIALYFEEKPLIIIEEPERSVHPSLVSRIMGMLKEASEKKQIIVTTYSPEIVKYADLEDLLFIYRDKEGFSAISRPGEKEGVKTFLENEIGIEELYIQNLLEV